MPVHEVNLPGALRGILPFGRRYFFRQAVERTVVCGADCTLGQLYVDREFERYTVEDVVRPAAEKIHGKTAIPEGRYQVIVTPSPRFRRNLPLLLKVPNFEGVRIHTRGIRPKTRKAASCPASPGTRRA